MVQRTKKSLVGVCVSAAMAPASTERGFARTPAARMLAKMTCTEKATHMADELVLATPEWTTMPMIACRWLSMAMLAQSTTHAMLLDEAMLHRNCANDIASEEDLSVSKTGRERLDEPGDCDARGVDVEIGDEDRTDGECKYKVGK